MKRGNNSVKKIGKKSTISTTRFYARLGHRKIPMKSRSVRHNEQLLYGKVRSTDAANSDEPED